MPRQLSSLSILRALVIARARRRGVTAHYFSEMPLAHSTFATCLIAPVGSTSPEWLTGRKNFRSDCCCGRARRGIFHLVHIGPCGPAVSRDYAEHDGRSCCNHLLAHYSVLLMFHRRWIASARTAVIVLLRLAHNCTNGRAGENVVHRSPPTLLFFALSPGARVSSDKLRRWAGCTACGIVSIPKYRSRAGGRD